MPLIGAVWSRIRLTWVLSNPYFHPFEVKFAVIGIDFGYFRFEFCSVALGETSHDDEESEFACFLAFRHLEDHVDAFFFGIADKSAGIDDTDLSFWFLGVMYTAPSVSFQLPHDPLCID